MANTVKTKLTLDGAELVQAQLKALGAAGTTALNQIRDAANSAKFDGAARAFDQVKRAGDTLSTGLKNIRNDLSPLEDGFKSLASAAGIALGGGLIGLIGGIILMSKSAVEATEANQRLAAGLGLTEKQLGALQLGFRDAGLGADQMTSAISRFSRAASTQGQQQLEALVEVSKAAAIHFGATSARWVNANDTIAASFQRLRPVAEQVLARLQETDPFRAAGISVDALVQFFDQAIRSGTKLKDAIAELGVKIPAQNSLEALDDIIKQNSTDLGKLGVNMLDAVGQPVSTFEGLRRFADLIKSMPDGLQKTALASQFFGREVGPQLIEQLNKGSAGVGDLIKQYEKYDLEVSKADQETARLANRSFLDLGTQATRLKNALGLIFAKPIADAAAGLASVIRDNSDAIKAFAADIASKAAPIIRDVINLLSGKSDQVSNQWIIDWANGFATFANSIKSAYDSVIKPAFDGILGALDVVAGAINKFAGTKLTGADLGIALIVGQITGINSAILDVIKTVGILALAFGPILSAVLSIGRGILSLGGLLLGAFDFAAITAGLGEIGALLLGLAAFAGWPALLIAAFGAVIVAIAVIWRDKFTDLFNFLINKAKQLGSFLFGGQSATDQDFSDLGGSAIPAHATGGLFRGRPGKDQNLALLSDLEYIMRPEAVRKYGVGFMHLINSMRFPLDQLRGFAVGGLVERASSALAIPRFAGGGLNMASAVLASGGSRGGRTLFLSLDNGKNFTGPFDGDNQIMRSLIRAARKSNRASAGRSPARVGNA